MWSESRNVTASPQPWNAFLAELDEQLPCQIQLHCLGAFVLKALYGLPRPTADLDYISVVPREQWQTLRSLAGERSKLAKKYKVCVQQVTVAEVPENFQERLIEIYPGRFSRLRLLALDAYDLILAKLTRNHPVDRDDAKFLARTIPLNPSVFQQRYESELRPNLANQERHDLTLKLWIEACFPQSTT